MGHAQPLQPDSHPDPRHRQLSRWVHTHRNQTRLPDREELQPARAAGQRATEPHEHTGLPRRIPLRGVHRRPGAGALHRHHPNPDRLPLSNNARACRGARLLRTLHPGQDRSHPRLGVDASGHAPALHQGCRREWEAHQQADRHQLPHRRARSLLLAVAGPSLQATISSKAKKSIPPWGEVSVLVFFLHFSRSGTAGAVAPPLPPYLRAPIAAPRSAKGSGTVKNLMKSGFEIPAAGMKVSARYRSRVGTFNVIRTSIRLLKNKPSRKPMTPPARALFQTILSNFRVAAVNNNVVPDC